MSQAFADAFLPAEAEHRGRVMHATWGHLAPEPRKKYPGFMVFAFGQYRDVVIESDYGALPDSPWLYTAEHDFALDKAKDRGCIYRFDGTVMMCKNGKFKFSGKVRKVRTKKK